MGPTFRLRFAALLATLAVGGCGSSGARTGTAPSASAPAIAAPIPTDVASASASASATVEAPLLSTPPSAMPIGSKLLGSVRISLPENDAVDGWLVESLAVKDQPAGVRGVLLPRPVREIEMQAFALAFEKASLEGMRRSRVAITDARQAEMLAFVAGQRDRETVRGALSDAGYDVYSVSQGTFLVRVRHVTKEGATDADLDALVRMLRDAKSGKECLGSVCRALDERMNDVGSIVLDGPPSALRIVGLIDPAPPPPPPAASRTARAVSPTKDRAAIDAALDAAGIKDRTVVAQAPLDGAGGTIALALWDDGERRVQMVMVDGDVTAIMPVTDLERTEMWGEERGVFEARFVDVDGDGRTELLARRNKSYYAGGRITTTVLVRAPTSLRGLGPPAVLIDRDYDPWLMRAKSADAALAAVIGAKPMVVADADVCALTAALGTPEGLARDATSDAIFIAFEEPSCPWYATAKQVSPLATSRADDRASAFQSCENAKCVGASCRISYEQPSSSYVWFARDASGKPRVTAVAYYYGS